MRLILLLAAAFLLSGCADAAPPAGPASPQAAPASPVNPQQPQIEAPPPQDEAPDQPDPQARDAPAEPEYGFSRENPIMLGLPEQFSGPRAQRMYLSALRDEQGRPFRFQRLGSVGAGPDGHILDRYVLVSEDDERFELYLDMYHPERPPLDQPPPRGMTLVREEE